MTNGLTGAFCDVLAKRHACLDPVPDGLAELFVDGVAVAIAGAAEPAPALLRTDPAGAGPGPVTAIGGSGRLPLLAAVRANGAAMHVLDYEPMWSPANHSVSTVLPALLGLVEARPDLAIDGPALLRAFAIGIEAQARLRRASRQLEPAELNFHPPGVVGPIGSAVAAGLLLGLDGAGLAHAVGIAASRAGALLANVGSMTKCLHCGAAAADGLEAALLAAAGFRADPDALAGPRGYLASFFGPDTDDSALTADTPLAAQDPGPAFKFYPSQYGTHFVIEAALAARRDMADGAAIEAVTITAPPMPYVDRPAPPSGLAGKFSFQYVAAAALLDGSVGLPTFSDDRRFRSDMEDLLPRIAVNPDPARQGRFDRMTVNVSVRTTLGTAEGACDGPPGIWGRPAAPERVSAKAADCLRGAGADPALLPRLQGVGRLDAAALAQLVAAL